MKATKAACHASEQILEGRWPYHHRVVFPNQRQGREGKIGKGPKEGENP